MLIDMDIEIVHDFFEFFMDFDFFMVEGGFAGFGLDEDDGFDGVFFDGLIALSIKKFELFVFLREEVLSEFVREGEFRMVLMRVIFFHRYVFL